MLRAVPILPLLLPALVRAAGEAAPRTLPPASAGSPDLAGSVGQMLVGLAIVIVVLVACLWLLKRLGAPRGSARGLKVLGAAPVGPRERVVLVEVADKVLVLGVAPGRVNTLHTLDPEQLAASLPAPAAPDGGGFAQRLKQMMEARKDG
jgi:flagellar protein FliO/FliZ